MNNSHNVEYFSCRADSTIQLGVSKACDVKIVRATFSLFYVGNVAGNC